MKKRRLFSIMAASVLAVSLLAGCGGKSATADGQTDKAEAQAQSGHCLLYTSPSPRDTR